MIWRLERKDSGGPWFIWERKREVVFVPKGKGLRVGIGRGGNIKLIVVFNINDNKILQCVDNERIVYALW